MISVLAGRVCRSAWQLGRSPNNWILLLAACLLFSVSLSSVQAQQSAQSITRKLDTIIIPQIEFRSTTLADAVEFLRQESHRLDPDPDPASRGINILLNLPPAPAPSTSTRVTLTLTRIPLREALKYVAAQAGLKVKVEPYAVSLVPLTDPNQPMVTAVFHVPPNFIPNLTSGDARSALDQPATAAH